MFSYRVFERLCKSRNVTPYQVSSATHVATSTLTMWKQGEYTPKADKILAIAKYFDVELEDFIEKKGAKDEKSN